MTVPTPAPAPDVNATDQASGNLENPAYGPNSQFASQQTDPYDGDPTTQPPQPVGQTALFNTDNGTHG